MSNDIEVLNAIHNTPSATLTHPDGTPLTWMGQLAGAIWLEAHYRETIAEYPRLGPSDRRTEHDARAMSARMLGLLAMVRGGI